MFTTLKFSVFVFSFLFVSLSTRVPLLCFNLNWAKKETDEQQIEDCVLCLQIELEMRGLFAAETDRILLQANFQL